jgi:hypothetical protein
MPKAAQLPHVCRECIWFYTNRERQDRPECRRYPPMAAPAYDAPTTFEFPKVDPENTCVCGEAQL